MTRFLFCILLAVVLCGCQFGTNANWPWDVGARETIVRDFNDDDIVEPCLTMEEKVKRLRALLCEDCDPAPEPVSIDIPLEIGVTPTISPTSAAPAAGTAEDPRVIKRIVTTYEGGLPKTVDVTPDSP